MRMFRICLLGGAAGSMIATGVLVHGGFGLIIGGLLMIAYAATTPAAA